MKFREVSIAGLVALAFVIASATALFASPVPTVPEPLSISLLGIGIVGLVAKEWVDRRRRK
jgi:hypothetical protein